MGQEITESQFDKSDFDRFYHSLKRETGLLQTLIDSNGFSDREPVAGFEIEAWLLDDDMQPNPINDEFLKFLDDPMASHELAKFNIELNNPPVPLTGDILTRCHHDIEKTWQNACGRAEEMNAHLLMIGTLPTLDPSLLNLENMSDLNRYRALNEQILFSRGKPIHLDITGNEHLKLEHQDVMLESATTSFQIHTQLPLNMAHHYYNASIIASAPVVALCANSPYLFGRDLWDESRIPLFEQAIETGGYDGAAHGPLRRVSFGSGYARNSIMECFTENLEHFPILLPTEFDSSPDEFEYLRLHNGTIWRWNRPLIGFDQNGAPHVRVEHRTPASGPTLVDMIANAAFYFGLTKNLCDEIPVKGIPFSFAQAKDNFYQSARHGLNSQVTWINNEKHRLHALFVAELIPRAVMGLKSLGVSKGDIEDYMDIIQRRLSNKQNGCCWQRQFIHRHPNDFKSLTRTYLLNQRSKRPVSEWEVE